MTIKCRAIKQQQKPLKQQSLTTHMRVSVDNKHHVYLFAYLLICARMHTRARAHTHTCIHTHARARTRVIYMKQALMKFVRTRNVSTVQLHRHFA